MKISGVIKKLFLTILLVPVLTNITSGQINFSDDFEAYEVGAPISSVNVLFWKSAPNTYTISNEKAYTGNKSLKLLWQGNSQSTLFSIPIKDNSYEVSFKFWKRDGENIDFSAFQSFGRIKFNNNNSINCFGGEENAHITYQSESWVEVKFQYFHKTNIFKYYVNGMLVSSFIPRYSVFNDFKINLYNNTTTYLDDFKVLTLDLPEAETNLTLFNIGAPRLSLAGAKFKLHASVINSGTKPVDGFTLRWRYNNEEKSATVSQKLLMGESYIFDIPDSVIIASGIQTINIDVSLVDDLAIDDDISDNAESFEINGIVPVGSKVLLEYGTGTWCGSCPAAIVSYRRFKQKFGHHVESVFMHLDDVMELPGYEFPQITGIPDLFINRYHEDYFFNEYPILKALEAPSIMEVKSKMIHDISQNKVFVSTDLTFKTPYNTPLYHSILIVEDSVRNDSYRYDQSNFYADGSLGEMGGFELLPSLIPANQMIYSNVPRQMINGLYGKKISIAADKNEVINLSELIPLDLNTINSNYYIYHIIMDIDRKIIDFDRAKISDVLQIVSNTNNEDEFTINVFPNPTANTINIVSSVIITDVKVKNVNGHVCTHIYVSANEYDVKVDLANYPSGIYFVEINGANKISTKKIVKM